MRRFTLEELAEYTVASLNCPVYLVHDAMLCMLYFIENAGRRREADLHRCGGQSVRYERVGKLLWARCVAGALDADGVVDSASRVATTVDNVKHSINVLKKWRNLPQDRRTPCSRDEMRREGSL